jgi:hypothetical protein
MDISNAYRNRWRRTWRSRAAIAGAGFVGIAAGAATIAATSPATSGAATTAPNATTPTTAPRAPSMRDVERFLFGDDAGRFEQRGTDPDGDNWTGGRDDSGGWRPTQQWQPQPQPQWQPQPQVTTRGS